jgi:NTP pyrophosphatase (non-canonical NTP hydrolase)
MNELYKRAIETFGAKKQILKSVEELTELSLALQHYLDGKCNKTDILVEMADVKIMLNQLALIFGEDKNIENQQIQKLHKRISEQTI